MKFSKRTIREIAVLICGDDAPDESSHFVYRSSMYLTQFFQDVETEYRHRGETRVLWVTDVLEEILTEPRPGPHTLPETFGRVIRRLMDRRDAKNEGRDRTKALAHLNAALEPEDFEAFYAEDGQCYLRHLMSNTIAAPLANPHRPFSAAELERRNQLGVP